MGKDEKTKKNTGAKRRRKLRKGSVIGILLFMFAVIITVLFILLKTKLFPVKTITASGSELYSSGEIINASGINNKTPIMGISVDTVKGRLQKALPYIETVNIKRKFPDTVTITVTDASEYFAFKTDAGYYVTGKNCRVLNLYEQLPENLIEAVVKGGEFTIGETVVFADGEQRELFSLIADYTVKKGIKLNSIDISDNLHITVHAEDRFEVLLGNRENIKEKIDHLAGMISEIGDRKGRINLEMWSKTDSKGTFVEGN